MSFLSKVEQMVREEMETEWCNIDMNIDDETFLKIAAMAHEKDITFNQMVILILEKQIAEMEEDE